MCAPGALLSLVLHPDGVLAQAGKLSRNTENSVMENEKCYHLKGLTERFGLW